MLNLQFGFNFSDLNSQSGLNKLDESFLQFLAGQNHDLHNKLLKYRSLKQININPVEYSDFLVQIAPLLDDYIAELFAIESENVQLKLEHEKFDVIYECRRKFVQRFAVKTYPKEKISSLDFEIINNDLKNLIEIITEQNIAEHYMLWQTDLIFYAKELDILAKYCAFMVNMNSSLMLFDIPKPVNENNHIRDHKISQLKNNPYLGFNYRDHQQATDRAHAQAKYCIYCHAQEKDSCSKGLSKPTYNDNKNGCPLRQKISEMNLLKSKGFNIGALAVTIIDNPLVAVTGHRICNDCMKACIFQKQDPVNIPLIESNILEQVLNLPWGVEIYLLLTKWNPLNIDQPLPLPQTNYNILITGLGPAGFALSHYLLSDGHNVTAIDGLKITSLDFDENAPIKYWSEIKLPSAQKIPQGFGGVAEYGITNRWDKNNLSLVRLILQRRSNFNMHGGIRLGSNITTDQAFALGFDHIALCIGAGKPKFDDIPGYFSKGVRIAADFLMNIQQSGAFITASNSNLQVRLPAVVIGCGLTAIDSAVELMHYYPMQVEKFLKCWENGQIKKTELNEEELIIADEFIQHARMFRAALNDEEKIKIIQNIGGVSICYRSSLTKSPAYRLNHEEIEHAIALGVKFEEHMTPQMIVTDQFNHAQEIIFTNGQERRARTVLIAIGTENNEFQDIDEAIDINSTIFKSNDNRISHFGDCNLKYAGSVVKALASVKNNYKTISEELRKQAPKNLKFSVYAFKSTVKTVNYIADDIIELVIHSIYAAQNFKAGQFYKLQNYTNNIKHAMEPLALTGIEADIADNTISFVIYKAGITSEISFNLKAGEEVMLMGPTGMPSKIFTQKKIVLIGENFGICSLLAIGNALKKNNCEIVFFAGYKKIKNRFFTEKIAEFADQIIWSCEEEKIEVHQHQDISFKGNIIDSLLYAKEMNLLNDIDHVLCSADITSMQNLLAKKQELFPSAFISCSVSPHMQCMMKGICGQCIMRVNNEQKYIFACACQNINIENIDFDIFSDRLKQNSLLERIK